MWTVLLRRRTRYVRFDRVQYQYSSSGISICGLSVRIRLLHTVLIPNPEESRISGSRLSSIGITNYPIEQRGIRFTQHLTVRTIPVLDEIFA